jgi:hypothetical protein
MSPYGAILYMFYAFNAFDLYLNDFELILSHVDTYVPNGLIWTQAHMGKAHIGQAHMG